MSLIYKTVWKTMQNGKFSLCVGQVVFFTNQMGIAKGTLKEEVFKSKVEDILQTLQLPVQVSSTLHFAYLIALRNNILLPGAV